MLHIRFQGRSFDVSKEQLGLYGNLNHNYIKQAVARFLGVNIKELSNYVVDFRPNGEITVRPEAVYG